MKQSPNERLDMSTYLRAVITLGGKVATGTTGTGAVIARKSDLAAECVILVVYNDDPNFEAILAISEAISGSTLVDPASVPPCPERN